MSDHASQQEKRDSVLEKLVLYQLNESLLRRGVITEKEHRQMQLAIEKRCKSKDMER